MLDIALTPVNVKGLRKMLGRLNVVLPETFYAELSGSARAHAFTVSQVAAADQLQAVLDDLRKHVAQGGTFGQWRNGLLARDDINQFLALPKWRQELVYRNNLFTQYAAGRGRQILDHMDAYPYLMYDAIDDTRTRPEHHQMNGFVAHVRDAIWRIWFPPNGHNCRCEVIPITAEEAAARGAMIPPDVQPDPDWDYSVMHDPGPALESTWRKKVKGYSEQIRAVFLRLVELSW